MTRPIGVIGVLSPAVGCWIGWLGGGGGGGGGGGVGVTRCSGHVVYMRVSRCYPGLGLTGLTRFP